MMNRCGGLAVLACLWLGACGDQARLERGAALYREHCLVCHGADLRGGGGVGVEGLSRVPADLTLLAFNAGGAFPQTDVLAILDNYAAGTQRGRNMTPFVHLSSDELKRVRTDDGRRRVPEPQADLLAYLEASQRP